MECPICQTEITDVNKCVGRCGHTFHLDCILVWCQTKNQKGNTSCPMCRSDFNKPSNPAPERHFFTDHYEDVGVFFHSLSDKATKSLQRTMALERSSSTRANCCRGCGIRGHNRNNMCCPRNVEDELTLRFFHYSFPWAQREARGELNSDGWFH